jgi:hypothetical protein
MTHSLLLVSISSTLFARVFRTKALFSCYVLAKKDFCTKNARKKTLMKLTAEHLRLRNMSKAKKGFKTLFLTKKAGFYDYYFCMIEKFDL